MLKVTERMQGESIRSFLPNAKAVEQLLRDAVTFLNSLISQCRVGLCSEGIIDGKPDIYLAVRLPFLNLFEDSRRVQIR
jgi:hypothetical protein